MRDGFLNPDFASRYVAFVAAFAERYPAVRVFTPFNEPTCTLDFSGYRGFWHPYVCGDQTYATMLRHTARATAEAIHLLRRMHPDAYILHVDTFEHHAALDKASAQRAAFLNERRFLFDDLVGGRVVPGHPLYNYLRRQGFSQRALGWYIDHPADIDERGGNYYPLNEEQLAGGATRHAPSRHARGFAAVASDYAQRLRVPISLTETNIQGTVRDRISWLKYMVEQAEELHAAGVPLRRFAWYPLFDCTGWNSLLQGKRWKRDPQGIFSCGRTWCRERTELSEPYSALARGLHARDIPAYTFDPRHDATLSGLKHQMQWDWQPQ